MYKYWIISFLLGSLLSKYNDNIYLYTSLYSRYIISFYILFILTTLLSKKFYINTLTTSFLKIFTIITAISWGASHTAPNINRSIKNVTILNSRLGFGSLIIQDKDTSYIYETTGTYRGTPLGSVRCFSSSNIFSNKHCMFINSEKYDLVSNNLLLKTSFKFKNFLYKNITSRSYLLKFKSFISGIIYGDKGISYFDKDIFKKLGIYHLLVISGLHFSLFAFFIREGILGIIKIFYIFKIISPLYWIKISIILNIIICIILAGFAFTVGLSSATQRALLIFIVHSLSVYISGNLTISKKIPLTLTLQSILFPLGFISVATFISWISYIFFIDLASTLRINKHNNNKTITKTFLFYSKIPYHYTHVSSYYYLSYIFYLLEKFRINLKFHIFKIFNIFYTQIKLMFIIYISFSQLSIISCITNLILVPIFPIVLFVSLYFSIFPQNIIDSYLYNILTLFFNLIDKFLYLENLFSSYIDIDKLSNIKLFKIFSLLISTVWIWNLYKKIFLPSLQSYLNINKISDTNEE